MKFVNISMTFITVNRVAVTCTVIINDPETITVFEDDNQYAKQEEILQDVLVGGFAMAIQMVADAPEMCDTHLMVQVMENHTPNEGFWATQGLN